MEDTIFLKKLEEIDLTIVWPMKITFQNGSSSLSSKFQSFTCEPIWTPFKPRSTTHLFNSSAAICGDWSGTVPKPIKCCGCLEQVSATLSFKRRDRSKASSDLAWKKFTFSYYFIFKLYICSFYILIFAKFVFITFQIAYWRFEFMVVYLSFLKLIYF